MESQNRVFGVETEQGVASITLRSLPDTKGIGAQVFTALADARISVDTILKNMTVNGFWDLTVTVDKNDLNEALKVVQSLMKVLGSGSVVFDDALAKVSIVGTGMQNAPGYAARMFKALGNKNINIHLITTSEIRITCVIQEQHLQAAVQSLHDSFTLS